MPSTISDDATVFIKRHRNGSVTLYDDRHGHVEHVSPEEAQRVSDVADATEPQASPAWAWLGVLIVVLSFGSVVTLATLVVRSLWAQS